MEEIKMEKKYFAGNLDKKVAFGLSWLLPIIALIELILDKDVLDLEEKREIVSVLVCAVACAVLSFTIVLPLVIAVFAIIAAIKNFMGKTFRVPGAYHIAAAIIK